MYVAFSVTLGMESTLATTTDVGSGTAHLTYSGDFGFNRAGGTSFTSAGGLADVNFEIMNAAEAGTITAGVEALLEAPKIILGAGIPSATTVFQTPLDGTLLQVRMGSGGRVFATQIGHFGALFEIDPRTGAVVHELQGAFAERIAPR